LQLLDLLQEAKHNYYRACQLLKKSEQHAVQMDTPAVTATEEERQQQQHQYERAKLDVDLTREKYQQLVKDIASPDSEKRQIYEKNMVEAFNHTQIIENKRLEFFKEIFTEYSKTLEQGTSFQMMYDKYMEVLKQHDSRADLESSYMMHGPGMVSRWPVFEEYQHTD